MLSRRAGVLVVLALAALALTAALQLARTEASVDSEVLAVGRNVPESITPLPDSGGSFAELAGEAAVDVTDPWAGYVAVRSCAEVMGIAGIEPTRSEELLAPLSSRGTTVCSFQTPEITLVGPDDLEVKGTGEGQFELQVLVVPPGLKADSSGLDDVLGAGGALLTVDIAPALRDEQPSESDAKNAGGGWIVGNSGVPNSPSVLSRLSGNRYLLRWFERGPTGLDLRLNLFVDVDIDGLLEQLGVQLQPNGS